MRRVPREELQRDIEIFFATLPGYQKTCLMRFGGGERIAKEMAGALAAKIDNGSSMVLVTEPVGFNASQRPGVWGVDEPDPAGPARPRDDVSAYAR